MESPNSPEEALAKIIEAWRDTPVVLASSSIFRKQQLEDLGFRDVSTAASIPEEIETSLAAEMAAHGGATQTWWDSDGRNFSAHIAAAKVEHVLQHQDIGEEQMVVGFDTVPVFYDERTDEQMMGVPKSSEKFPTQEAAKAGILEQFNVIAQGCEDQHQRLTEFRKQMDSYNWNEEAIEQKMVMHALGIRRGHIYIITGVAVSFPHEHSQTHRFTEEVILYSEAIFAARHNPEALEKLAELVLSTMGERALQISGGIDYADSYVRDILKISERHIVDEAANENLYRGFAPRALAILLDSKTHE